MAKVKVDTSQVEAAAKQVQQAGATTREAVGCLAGASVSSSGVSYG
jgi:hypothetical protein